MGRRVRRISSTIQHCLGDILINDINNPELKFISITGVEISPDLRFARVFISVPEGIVTEPIQKLHKAKGYIKRMLAKKMTLKYIPDIEFIETEPGFSKPIEPDGNIDERENH